MSQNKITLYGTGWCPKTSMLSNAMQADGYDFDFKNVEDDLNAAEEVKKLYNGKLKFPTVVIGEKHIKNPSISELLTFLK